MLTAFGPQEDFAYPPRPADPKAAWNLEWTVRVRHRSIDQLDGHARDGRNGRRRSSNSRKPDCKPKGGLGGMLGGVLKPGC